VVGSGDLEFGELWQRRVNGSFVFDLDAGIQWSSLFFFALFLDLYVCSLI
jgi:hypothetical protein